MKQGELAQVSVAEIPPSAANYIRIARLKGSRQIPPDHAGAVEFFGLALQRTPLRSDLWVTLARHLFFLKRKGEAEAALRRSDVLDPVYPEQRLGAVQLWALMGERERGIELARQVAALDPPGRLEALRTLLLIGVPPEEAYSIIGAGEVPVGDLAEIMKNLKSGNPDTMRKLWAKLPPAAIEDARFRNAMAEFFASPMLDDVAATIWRRESSTVAAFPLPGSDTSLWLDNPSVDETPFTNRFYYGWQPFPLLSWVDGTWNRANSESGDRARIRMTFTGGGAPTIQRTLQWMFYRLPLPATAEPVSIRIPVMAEPPGDSVCRVSARIDGRVVNSAPSDWTRDGWQYLEVKIPASASPSLVELTVERQKRGAGADGSARVYLGGFEFVRQDPPAPTDTPEESPAP